VQCQNTWLPSNVAFLKGNPTSHFCPLLDADSQFTSDCWALLSPPCEGHSAHNGVYVQDDALCIASRNVMQKMQEV
jgi:hypothetical protein